MHEQIRSCSYVHQTNLRDLQNVKFCVCFCGFALTVAVAISFFRYDCAMPERTHGLHHSGGWGSHCRSLLNEIASSPSTTTSSSCSSSHSPDDRRNTSDAAAIVIPTSAIVRIVYGTLHICGGRWNILDGVRLQAN